MEEIPFFLDGIATLYGQRPSALTPLRRRYPMGKLLYRVDFPEGPSWVMRAYTQSYTTTDEFHFLSRSLSLVDWLQAQARLLAYLTTQAYPVPAVIPTRAGTRIGESETWYMLINTFVDGDAKDASPAKMAAVSASLGHLHTLALPTSEADVRPLAASWWAQSALHEGLTRLTSSVSAVTEAWRPFYEACLQTFHTLLAHAPLPQTLIHGDCWAENAIQTSDGQAQLIDWECAGIGMSVLDFGSLLLHCHLGQRHHFAEGVTPQYQPDPQRIAAVIQGYTRWRHLLFEEREVLLEAVRFSSAWRGAWFFSFVEKSGLTVSLENALRNWQQWYMISEEITRLALEQMEKRWVK